MNEPVYQRGGSSSPQIMWQTLLSFFNIYYSLQPAKLTSFQPPAAVFEHEQAARAIHSEIRQCGSADLLESINSPATFCAGINRASRAARS